MQKINLIKKRKMKREKSAGITLIALVITIIVLLILAGISIATLAGDNGILTRSAESKEKTEKAQIIENAKMDILAEITENHGENITDKQLKSVLSKYFSDVPDTLPNDLSELSLTSKDKRYTINANEIYNGMVKSTVQEAGLYDATTGELKKSWDELMQEDIIRVENGIVSSGRGLNRQNILNGQILFPNGITEFASGVFAGCTGLVR